MTRPRDALSALLRRQGERMPEVMWRGALGMLEGAACEARLGLEGRFRLAPWSELRRLERAVADALEVAELAIAIAEERNRLDEELEHVARERAAGHAKRARREQTREAERVRLLNGRARREGRALTPEERWPWIYADEPASPASTSPPLP